MTCAKANVLAKLTTKAGEVFIGTNACMSPQHVCPRLEGEGYAKCSTICSQPYHAEIAAIIQAGARKATGGSIVVYHSHICDNCRSVCESLDIKMEVRHVATN